MNSKIQTFLQKFDLTEEQKDKYYQIIVALLYLDMFERIANILPEPEKTQAQGYLKSSNPEVDPEIHQNIKDIISKYLTKDLVDYYLENNLDKILSRFEESIHKYSSV